MTDLAIDANKRARNGKRVKDALTAQRLRERLIYDPDAGIFTRRIDGRGKNSKAGTIAGCDMGAGYLAIMIDGVRYKAHRLAWLYVYGEWPGPDLDHRNGTPSDNRIKNLRNADATQQTVNSKRRCDNKSGIRGVCFHKASGKWQAQISYRGQGFHLGVFPTKELATAIYRAKARELFGEFYRADT